MTDDTDTDTGTGSTTADAIGTLSIADADDDATPESIDTSVEQFLVKNTVKQQSSYAIDVGLRAVSIRRIDFERESDESIADWIRGAVDCGLDDAVARDGITPTEHDREQQQPPIDGSRHDPTGVDIIAAISNDAEPGDWIGVPVAFPPTTLELVADATVKGQTVCDWIRIAVHVQFSRIDRELEHEFSPRPEIEIPHETATRARLRAEFDATLGDTDYEAALLDALYDLAIPLPIFTVCGEVIARADANDEAD